MVDSLQVDGMELYKGSIHRIVMKRVLLYAAAYMLIQWMEYCESHLNDPLDLYVYLQQCQ
jgi:hypothetical protein